MTPDEIARRHDGDTAPIERRHFMAADHFVRMNRRQMRRDRLRDAWATIRPAVWLVVIGLAAWLAMSVVEKAVRMTANPTAGVPW